MQPPSSISRNRAISASAACVAMASAAVSLLALAALHVLSPEFSPAWRMVSEYANGRYGWVLSVMFASWGLSSWALVVALRFQPGTNPGRIALLLLALAGLGQAMAAVFDINHDALHSLAGALGILCLPAAAVLISHRLCRTERRSHAGTLLRWAAHLTWISVVALAGAFAIFTLSYLQVSPELPATAPSTLPAGVIGLVGWANRLLVVAYCAWAIAVAWQSSRAAAGSALPLVLRSVTQAGASPD
jgi:hypothetical protein